MQLSNHKNIFNLIGIGIAFYISMLTVVGTFSILFRNLLFAVSNHPILNAISTELFSLLLMVLCALIFKTQLRKMDFSNFRSIKITAFVLLVIWIISNLIQAFIIPEIVIQLIHKAADNKNNSVIDNFISILVNLIGNLVGILILTILFFNFKTSELKKDETCES